tara:strand:- start:462 stop:710 length:249 start_codon:yes stop_codon:yes gene_type:complete
MKNEKCFCLKGFVLSNNEAGNKDLQRCDACDVFADDEEAKQYVLDYITNTGKHLEDIVYSYTNTNESIVWKPTVDKGNGKRI